MTDAVWSPGLGKNIGYVWVPIELAEPGNAISAESEHGTLTGRTAAIPSSTRARSVPPLRSPDRLSEHARTSLRRPVRAGPDRAGDGSQPVLPGASLQRHGLARTPAAMPPCAASRRRAVGRWCAPRRSSSITPPSTPRTSKGGSGRTPTSLLTSGWSRSVHEHGSLAGIELVHGGMMAPNLYSRESPMGPGHLAVHGTDPVQARRMTRADIDDLRRWHRQAVARSLRAGYDLVYVYAGHGLTTIQHFLSRRLNDRDDEYGGPISHRVRLLREMLEDTLEEVDGRAAVACRICVDELVGGDGIQREEISEALGLVGELPDLWDFMVGDWDFDSNTSRFSEEAFQEQYVRGLKQFTTKPVVGVGRFTSPDTMVRMVRDGVLDMIGAARPSIADPFLPKKIEEGRWQDIRECIGCNICVTGDFTATPLRCTQNPTMGEEWRRGWHPERIRAEDHRCHRTRRGCRTGRPRSGAGTRQARLRRGAGRGHQRARRQSCQGGAPARPFGMDPGAGLPQGPAGATAQRGARIWQRVDRRRGARVRLRPRGDRNRSTVAKRRRRPLARAPDRDRPGHAGAHTRRRDGRRSASRRTRSCSSTTTTTTWAVCSPSCS